MFRHPEPGDRVGDYRLVERLGDGTFGLVFKAERAGRFFALKFLHDANLGARARREVAILAEMEHPCVVRFQGFERWPVPIIGTPYIVMDLVDGLTLETHAATRNPSARKATHFVFQIGLTLGEVHQRGVFHRDLKPTNIIITSKGEVPVLIDFGVGWHVGAPAATDEGSLPGTLEFQPPEAFQRLGRYECRPSDELWALGVCFYWLLTDILPFGDRTDDGFLERVLHLKPIPPHVLNPRVPEVLSSICMRMLEKKPEDRYGSVVDLCAALDKALADAASDAGWDLPLFDPDAPSTKEVPAWLDESDSMRWIRRWMGESPRRGWKPAQEVGAAAMNQGEKDGRPGVREDAAAAPEPASIAAPVAPVVLAPVGPPAAAAPLALPSRAQRWAPAWRQGPVWPMGPLAVDLLRRPALALVVGVAAVSLMVGLSRRPAPASEGATAITVADKAAPPPVTSPGEDVTGQKGSVREVAQSGNPPEAGKGAAPIGAPTPAPKATAMLRNRKSRSKAEEKPAPPSQPEAPGCIPISEWRCKAAGVCSLVLIGCTGASSQVRPAPGPEACPANAVKTMEKLGFGDGYAASASLTLKAGRSTVRGGEVSATLIEKLGELQAGTVLHGRFIVGESRVYGRFTLAQKPNGDTFPVCVQMRQGREPGVERLDKGGEASAEIGSSFFVEAVERFE